MSSVWGFPPIAAPDAAVLILGTMPGKESLRAQQYYAHPRNAFWPIVGDLVAFDPSLPYAARTQRLIDHRIAVWDVLQLCTRASSLDSDIVDPVANDFRPFLATHPLITRVYFNGAAAERLFRKHVVDTLAPARPLDYLRLPSTSPAHATPFATKRAAWQAVAT